MKNAVYITLICVGLWLASKGTFTADQLPGSDNWDYLTEPLR